MPMFFTLTVDTEEEWDWSLGFPREDYSVRNILALPAFHARCVDLGAAVTYFTNHAVLADSQASAVIKDLAGRPNAEIGLHIHPWNTPPLDEMVSPRNSFLHNLPIDLMHAKLRGILDRFAALGISPTSYRGGRYSTSPAIQSYLRAAGILADCSPVPFTTFEDDGAPDFADCDPFPRRLLVNGKSLWSLPLSRAFTRADFRFWQRVYHGISKSWLSKLRLIGMLEKLRVVRKIWMNFEQHDASEILALIPTLRALQVPYLCFTMHSSSLLPGAGPYVKSQDQLDRFLDKIALVLGTMRREGAVPATMTEIARHLEADADACSRYQSAG